MYQRQSPTLRALDPQIIDVWYSYVEKSVLPARREAYLALLSDDEQNALACFVNQDLQDEYLLTRVLCRSVLSRYFDIRPDEWRFDRTAYGRPFVVAPEGGREVAFNLTNCRSVVAIAVSTGKRKIGVDIELLTRIGDIKRIADSCFSSQELIDLACLPNEQKNRRFVELWTCKEAYIKAEGLGLSLPLDSFSIQFEGDAISVASWSKEVRPDPCWQFMLKSIGGSGMLALCAQRIAGRDAMVCFHEPDLDFSI
jgi:4'-phosphopantetheinyl transferase